MKPLLLHYYLTNRCNSRCTFCSIWQETPKLDAQKEDVLRNLFSARKAGCRFVDFTGGEPLLHCDLPELLSGAKKLGFITSVTTNCILFPKRAKELRGKIDLLHFSIDAGTAGLHDILHGIPSFDKVLESIDIALSQKMVPDLLFTYTDDNIDTFEGVYDLARKKNLILILDPLFNTKGGDILKSSTHQKALKYAEMKGVYLNKAHLKLRKMGGNHIRDPLCKAVESTIVVLPDNRLALPCYHHRIDSISINGNLKEMLSSKARMEAMEKQGKYSFCEKCHINCYFDPSYTYMRNSLFWQSMYSKFRYSWTKYLVYHRFKDLFKLFF